MANNRADQSLVANMMVTNATRLSRCALSALAVVWVALISGCGGGGGSPNVVNIPAPLFGSPVLTAMGGSPRSLNWGDFNGDGKVDVVFTLPGGAAFVMLGNNDGTFQSAHAISGLSAIHAAAVGDLNRDGKLDLAVAGCPIPSCPGDGPWLFTLLGNGDGTFQSPVAYQDATFAQVVSIGDVNSDGIPDVVVGRGVGSVPVLLGNGDGTLDYSQFWPVQDIFPGGGSDDITSAIAIVDMDGNGKQDLVVFSSELSEIISVLRGLGDASFLSPLIQGDPYLPTQIAFADLNRDGIPDVVINGNQKGLLGGGPGRVVILPGNGSGLFGSPVYPTYPAAYWNATFAIGELERDGNQDLVIRASDTTDLSILYGNGDGTFLPAESFPLSLSGSVNRLIDLNGDGRPDLVLVTATGIAVLPNTH